MTTSAGERKLELHERSLAALDWPEVLARLAERAHSEAGREACLALPFAADADEARAGMTAVAELAAVLRRGESLPSLAVPPVTGILAAAQKGLVLGAEEVRPIADLLAVADGVRRFFDGAAQAGRAPMPEVSQRAAAVDAQPALGRVLRETFDSSGEIRDSVSPTLARLRRERAQLADGARGAIEELMRASELTPYLQDQYVTVREERYVLPIKASAKSMGLGIVHDTSRTGETVYVEPMQLVAANNRLKVAELEIRDECRRILEDLTERVAAAAPELHATAEALVALDVLAAQARLGVDYDGVAVEMPAGSVIDLRQARHPLLALRAARERFRLIANDAALGAGGPRLLIVSGPNAGGKTVLLKTVALSALLARAGMLVPAAPGSRVGFFDAVLADIGDQQSVMGDLSTFSGHLAHVAEILRQPEGDAGGALVLLDELMAGTNPEQGAALARATAEALAERRGVAVITTHYDSLKALADTDARFVNAGMEYDMTNLRPTFRLAVGTPGRSYALDIATRLGLPAPLLERARALAGATSVGLEAAIAGLEAREAHLAEEARRLTEARQALSETEEAQREATVALERRERELGKHSREAIEAQVRETREALRAIVRDAQRAGTSRAAEDARSEVERVAREAAARLPQPVPPPPPEKPATLEVGARVFVPSMGAEGIVTRAADARGRVKVTVGALTVEVDAAQLGKGTRAARDKRPAPFGAGAARGAGPDELSIAIQSPTNTLDLRGQRADEALGAVERFLDRAALEGNSPLFIVHGHGTGALRKEVRAYLERSPYVARWTPGGPRQGGDGVSLVELR